MSDCFAVSIGPDGYQFTPCEKGEIHLTETTDTPELRTIAIELSQPANAVINRMEIQDFSVKSSLDDIGEIGLHVSELDRFLDGADRSPYSVTVSANVRAFIARE